MTGFLRAIRPLGVRLDERGVALPLALLGLVSVSLLVTTALVTSSTELAISSAHQDATRALYVAEGGLQAYVAENGDQMWDANGQSFAYTPPGGDGQDEVTIAITHLGEQALANDDTLGLFSVSATPVRGGSRSVATIVRLVLPPVNPLNLNVTSALTLGGDLDVNGNSFTVSGVVDPANACGSTGVEAVRMAEDAMVEANSEGHMDNFIGVDDDGNVVQGRAAIVQDTLSRDELAMNVLGMSLEEIIERVPASKKWGPRFTPPGEPLRVFDGYVSAEEKIAVVDADSGTVSITGGYGILIVVNGNIDMGGSSRFEGVIIVEGSFRLHGRPQVLGGLVSLSTRADNEIILDEEAQINGNVTVQYDKCAIDDAIQDFNTEAPANRIPTVLPTTGWFEVVE